MRAESVAEGILRLKVPFEELYTAVFFVQGKEEWAVIDTATTCEDVDTYILPALNRLPKRATHLLLTHGHADHAGGAERLLEAYPDLRLYTAEDWKKTPFSTLSDGALLLGRLQTVFLTGHSKRSVGYFDLPTGTLISGDCLQQAGVGKYTNGISDPEAYLASIERLRRMPIERIVASHDYVPLGAIAEGRDAVARYLDVCEQICREKFSLQ